MNELEIAALKITEKAAIDCYDWIGRGNNDKADKAAVESMRNSFNELAIDGTIVIGEGERDKAPMLFVGEKVGKGGKKIDIAVDPLEGTTICANGDLNSLTVLAMAEQGNLLHAPDVYMEKIAVGKDVPFDAIDLDNSPAVNLKNISKAKNKDIRDLTVIILDRPRHQELITKVRETGARVQLIQDGDIKAVICAADNYNYYKADVYMGIGGAPEGVLAAAALLSLGGNIMGRLLFKNDEEKQKALKVGINDFNKKYSLNELARGDVIFSATWVTDGEAGKAGVLKSKNYTFTNSLLMRSSTNTIRNIQTINYLK